MVLRNRLLSLLLRLTFFVLYVVATSPYIAQYDSVWLALCTFNVEMMFLMSIMMGFEIIFNFIDLVRHGMRGASAGPYMPFALPLTAFSIASGIFYFTSMLPRDAAPGGTFGIMFNVLLIVIPLLDYLLIDEKGTVSFSAVLVWQVYPILFHVFGYFRTLIWPDSGIYNGYMYALPFLNYSGPYIFWWSLMFFATTLGGGALLVVFGNILSGRYRNYDLRAD
ncbi:MAG: hypothetical protein IJS52_01265 [Bacilli bacterium]|nr:hypothetical protein [Bacilli bacterium]